MITKKLKNVAKEEIEKTMQAINNQLLDIAEKNKQEIKKKFDDFDKEWENFKKNIVPNIIREELRKTKLS